MVIIRSAVAQHGRDVRENDTGAVVLVSIKKETKAFELVNGAEDGALESALFGYPHSHAVAEEVVGAMDLVFPFDFPVGSGQGKARPEPAGGALVIFGGETNVSRASIVNRRTQ